MTFLNRLVALVASMRPIWAYSLNYLIALAFLATFPYIVFWIFKGRK